MPKAARERIANPRAGAALAPHSGLPPEGVPRERDSMRLCNGKGDRCQEESRDYSDAISTPPLEGESLPRT